MSSSRHRSYPKAVTDLATLKRAVLLNTRLRSHQENPAYNLPREAQDWSAALDRITGNKPKAGTSAEVDFTQRTIGLLVQSISVSQGHYDDSAAILEDVLADAESAGDDEAVLLALTMLGECATATGRPETGARLSGRALSLITSNGHRWRIHYEYVLTRHVMALIRSSQWSDIATVHQQYWATSWRSSVYSGGAIDFARSLVSLTQARTQHQPQTQGRDIGPGGVELAQLAAAIEGLKCHDLEHLLPLSLGTAAYVAALLKQRELAEQYCADFGRAQQGGPRDLQLLSQGFSAAADYLLTKDERTIQELASLANQAQDAGMATTELELRLLMLGNGTMPSGTRLLALTEQMEGPQAALTHSCVQAIAEGNVTRLLQVADDARETAHGILALICLKEALRLAEHAGNPTEIRKVRQTLALAHGKPINPGNLVQTTKLTKRERAVAALAIDGQSNAGIADKLFLSVRTVEGHLYKVFEKLGINRREDLTRDHLNEH